MYLILWRRIIHALIASLIAILLCHHTVSSARIALVATSHASHQMELRAVGMELARRGHQVYAFISSEYRDKAKLRRPQITDIEFQGPKDDAVERERWERWITEQGYEGADIIEITKKLSEAQSTDCSYAMSDTQFLTKARNIKLDFAFVDRVFISPCYLLIPYVLGVPYASISSIYEIFLAASPTLPSFVPALVEQRTDDMAFTDRLQNFFDQIKFFGRWMDMPGLKNITLLHKHAPEVKDWMQLVQRSQIFFVSDNHILNIPRPTLPNVVLIPSLNMEPARPLTNELEQLVNQSVHGVILLTFGSTARNIPVAAVKKILQTFSRIKQTVIWKVSFNDEYRKQIGDIPSNVHLLSWVPQNDILGHRNTRIFITHCGNNGQYESVYHAVPMIGFPLFSDQRYNAYRMETKGIGIGLNLKTFNPDDLEQAINTIIEDQSYITNIRRLSAIMRDQPFGPRETVVYWIEHVIKFGDSHLRSHAMSLSWIQYFSLDLITFQIISLFALATIMAATIRSTYCSFTYVKLKKEQH